MAFLRDEIQDYARKLQESNLPSLVSEGKKLHKMLDTGAPLLDYEERRDLQNLPSRHQGLRICQGCF